MNDNCIKVLDSAYDSYPQNESRDFLGILLSSEDNSDELIESAISSPYKGSLGYINEMAINVTDAHIVKEKKGKGISIKINGKEYRYVSPNRSTEDLFRSFMGMMNHANAGYKALNYLRRNALCYYGSKDPEGKDLVESLTCDNCGNTINDFADENGYYYCNKCGSIIINNESGVIRDASMPSSSISIDDSSVGPNLGNPKMKSLVNEQDEIYEITQSSDIPPDSSDCGIIVVNNPYKKDQDDSSDDFYYDL